MDEADAAFVDLGYSDGFSQPVDGDEFGSDDGDAHGEDDQVVLDAA